MISRSLKGLFYVVASPLMKFNGVLYRYLRSPSKESLTKVHLGPGQKKYIEGWINIDANMFTGKCDVWFDLRSSMPFDNSAIDALYSHHVIEHLPNLRAHLQDAFRCLKPGAVYRLAGPHGDNAIKCFIDNRIDWFGDWPDKRKSIGGRLENMIFCRGEHLTILTFSYLEEILTDSGFVNIRTCLPSKETYFPALFLDCLVMEEESDFSMPHSLVIEAMKP